MGDQPGAHLEGRLCSLYLRVESADQAARFFGRLLGSEPWRRGCGTHAEQRFASQSRLVADPIEVVLTDDPEAAPQRLCFATPDLDAALHRSRALGGQGADTDHVLDDQGLALAFCSPSDAPPARHMADGGLGPLIAHVPETARARVFLERLFGLTFHRVGSGDFWWVSQGPALGVFPLTHDETNPEVERNQSVADVRPFFCAGDLDTALAKVRDLGGETLSRSAIGPYQVAACVDDQKTPFCLWFDPSA